MHPHRFAILMLTIFWCGVGFSQRFGVHGGINFMNATVSNSNADTGYLVGAHFNHVLVSEFISVRPEFNLNRVGAENSSFGGTGTTRFTYVEVPLIFRLSFYTKVLEVFALAGPKVAYLLSASNSQGTPIQTADRESLEYGFYLGIGAGVIPRGATRLHFIARYVFGITDIDTSAASYKSNGFQLLVSVTL